MTPSQKRRAYKLRRIVISEHNYFALKRLGQAGDSFNDVISNLLRIERNHREEKEKEKLREQHSLQNKQKKSKYDTDQRVSDLSNDLNSSSVVNEVMEKQRQQMDELFRSIEEMQEKEKLQERSSNK